ncbi:MAG: 4-alpha-glucanotransferase [Gammaproteobacteria bacterium]
MHKYLTERRAGVLLHPSSLPGAHDPGGSGNEAHRFIDFLDKSGFSVWQTLPLGPTHEDSSPYQCLSVHAGNSSFINLDDLAARGWLKPSMRHTRSLQDCLIEAHSKFIKVAQATEKQDYIEFKNTHSYWLSDYSLYQAIRHTRQHASWFEWEPALRDRQPRALRGFGKRHADLVEQACFEQYLFFSQWCDLRAHANERGVQLFGDMPIYVAHDSADVWANRDLFTIDGAGALDVVAGVPPDYFSETGQRWGNPLYRWDVLKQNNYGWWVDRFRTQLELFDVIRLDHFRGFEKYWEIPAASETAINGRWMDGPGADLFRALEKEFGELPLVAEDLGVITPEVDALRLQFGFPGMKILQFAFESGPDNPYLPKNHEPLSVVYTGTHDNDTTLGWYEHCSREVQQLVHEYLDSSDDDMPWPLIRAALQSAAILAIIPMQDLLALGSEHRMNTPGSLGGNWHWQFDWEQVPDTLPDDLRALLTQAGRVAAGSRAIAR